MELHIKPNQQESETSQLRYAPTVILSIQVKKERLKPKVELKDLEENINQINFHSIVFETMRKDMNIIFSIEDKM